MTSTRLSGWLLLVGLDQMAGDRMLIARKIDIFGNELLLRLTSLKRCGHAGVATIGTTQTRQCSAPG